MTNLIQILAPVFYRYSGNHNRHLNFKSFYINRM